jgi:hypothetical protein
MKSSNASTALLIVFGGLAVAGFVACGSEEDGAVDASGTGGTTSATVGGATSTGNTTRGGATTGSGGANASRGGSSATATGGRASGVGGRASGVGGRASGVGGIAMAGFAAIDPSCLEGGVCTANCSAACPGTASAKYSCTCDNGQLSCDYATCVTAIVGDTCPTGTADGKSCDSAVIAMCAPSGGGTVCFCSSQSNQWTCF